MKSKQDKYETAIVNLLVSTGKEIREVMKELELTRCKDCKDIKPNSEFYDRKNRGKTYKFKHCKECNNKRRGKFKETPSLSKEILEEIRNKIKSHGYWNQGIYSIAHVVSGDFYEY